MKMKFSLLRLLIIFFMVLPRVSFAQLTEPFSETVQNAPPPPADPVDTPIDGGLSILIGTGVAYGIKKIRDERKRKKHQQQLVE
mgnify:CR=1 FL=1